jgi:hypothetical protein
VAQDIKITNIVMRNAYNPNDKESQGLHPEKKVLKIEDGSI